MANYTDKITCKCECPICNFKFEHEQELEVWLPEGVEPESIEITVPPKGDGKGGILCPR